MVYNRQATNLFGVEKGVKVQDSGLAKVLGSARFALLDMDGVLYRGKTALPGLIEFFSFLRQHNIRFLMLTNNSSQMSADYARKLAGMGVEVSPAEVLNSGQATAAYLRQISPQPAGIYVVGMQPLRDALFGGNNEGHFTPDDDTPQFVVQGGDFELVYNSVKRACLHIRRGAQFIVTNADPVFPSEEGLIPGAGSIGALLSTATGKYPFVVGKPEPTMYQMALKTLNATPAETIMIGDNLLTDIDGANRLGIPTVLTLSGVTTLAEYEISKIRASLTFQGLPELVAAWQQYYNL